MKNMINKKNIIATSIVIVIIIVIGVVLYINSLPANHTDNFNIRGSMAVKKKL